VYPNFPDPDLDDAGRAYHGGNYPRLLKIKANYDPNNLFRFKQSVPIHGIRSGVAPYDATKDSDSRVDDGSK
jgi:hypothetical protein